MASGRVDFSSPGQFIKFPKTAPFRLEIVDTVDTASCIAEQNRAEHNFIDIKLRPLTGSVRARYKNKAYT